MMLTAVGGPTVRVPGRTCGSCTLCCRVMKVESLDKPANVWCPACAVGTGCTIYDQRPSDCATYQCLWLMGAGPDEARPDRSGVVLGILDQPLYDLPVVFAVVHPDRPDAWRRSWVRTFLDGAVLRGAVVLVTVGSKRIVHARPDIHETLRRRAGDALDASITQSIASFHSTLTLDALYGRAETEHEHHVRES